MKQENKGGRPRALTPDQVRKIRKLWHEQRLPVTQIAKEFRVTDPTIYAVINQRGPYKSS